MTVFTGHTFEYNKEVFACEVIRKAWQDAHDVDRFINNWFDTIEWYRAVYHQSFTYQEVVAYVRHCMVIHDQFLSRLYVERTTMHIVCIPLVEPKRVEGCTFLSDYVRETANYQRWALWYALYFDCVSYLFIVAVTSADHEAKSIAYYWYEKLNSIHTYLSATTFEKRYARQLKRYQELMGM